LGADRAGARNGPARASVDRASTGDIRTGADEGTLWRTTPLLAQSASKILVGPISLALVVGHTRLKIMLTGLVRGELKRSRPHVRFGSINIRFAPMRRVQGALTEFVHVGSVERPAPGVGKASHVLVASNAPPTTQADILSVVVIVVGLAAFPISQRSEAGLMITQIDAIGRIAQETRPVIFEAHRILQKKARA
jgi:hypothetical protein